MSCPCDFRPRCQLFPAHPLGSTINKTTWDLTPGDILCLGAVMMFILTPPVCIPLALSHWDLEGANETCDGKAICDPHSPRSRAPDDFDWRDRNCLCDTLCAQYGDCCLDSPFFVAAEQRRGVASFTCVELRQFGGVYMHTACPPEWSDAAVRIKCEADPRY
ncbi:unnamed protein product, partial [Timema podura]|nr:unnamed protein product [Timema podura]